MHFRFVTRLATLLALASSVALLAGCPEEKKPDTADAETAPTPKATTPSATATATTTAVPTPTTTTTTADASAPEAKDGGHAAEAKPDAGAAAKAAPKKP